MNNDPVEERDVQKLLVMLDDLRVRRKIAAFLEVLAPDNTVAARVGNDTDDQ